MNISPSAYALIGLTAIIASLAAVLTFAVLRLMAAARDTSQRTRQNPVESALLSAALQDAVAKLKLQERAMAARAEASERLSGEIIASLTAGAVAAMGEIRNPESAGRFRTAGRAVRAVTREQPPRCNRQCLKARRAISRESRYPRRQWRPPGVPCPVRRRGTLPGHFSTT